MRYAFAMRQFHVGGWCGKRLFETQRCPCAFAMGSARLRHYLPLRRCVGLAAAAGVKNCSAVTAPSPGFMRNPMSRPRCTACEAKSNADSRTRRGDTCT